MSGSVAVIFGLATILSGAGCTAGQGQSTTMNTVNYDSKGRREVLVSTGGSAQAKTPLPVRGETNETYRLAPGALVEVTGLQGPVEVETHDGDQAEIHLVREAKTQKDYDCDKIRIRHTPNSLALDHEQDPRCDIIFARERLRLVVPRSANLTFRRIEGDLTVGVTDGVLRLHEVEGYVRVAGAQSAEMKSLEKGLTLTIPRLGAQGVDISRVEGPVDLGITSDINADLNVSNYSSDLRTEIPGSRTGDGGDGRRSYRARLGSGGGRISLSYIEGDVRIRRE